MQLRKQLIAQPLEGPLSTEVTRPQEADSHIIAVDIHTLR